MGVAAVVGSEELAGDPLAPVEGEAPPDAEAEGDGVCSTYVVPLSPPHAATPRQASPRISATPNPFTKTAPTRGIIGPSLELSVTGRAFRSLWGYQGAGGTQWIARSTQRWSPLPRRQRRRQPNSDRRFRRQSAASFHCLLGRWACSPF